MLRRHVRGRRVGATHLRIRISHETLAVTRVKLVRVDHVGSGCPIFIFQRLTDMLGRRSWMLDRPLSDALILIPQGLTDMLGGGAGMLDRPLSDP